MENTEKSKRWRSPNYPLITLQRAFELIETLYKNHNINFVALEVIGKDWGFSSTKSSYLAQHIGALSSYALIVVEGVGIKRRIKISDFAFKIIIDKRPESAERKFLIREAALAPDIFRKIYNAYPIGLPSDKALEYELINQFRFNPTSVNDFIGIFKRTMVFAKVYESGIMGDEIEPIKEPDMTITDKSPIKDSAGMLPPSPPRPDVKSQLLEINVLFSTDKLGKVYIPYPLTTDEWSFFEGILQANKPSLVPSEKKDDDKKEPENK